MIRTGVIQHRDKNFISFSRVVGTSNSFILMRHLLPSIAADLAVLASLDIGWAIINISTMSFLGLGVQPPVPDWSVMVSDAMLYYRSAPHLVLIPGVCILLLVASINILASELRNRLDVRWDEVRR